MVEVQRGRKRKRGGEEKASGSENAKGVVMSAEKQKTRSASREEAASAARSVRERKSVDRFVAGAPLAQNVEAKNRGEKLAAEAQRGRKKKRGGEAKTSVSGTAKSVVMSAEKRKTRSASREVAASAARAVRERKPVDRFVAGAPLARNVEAKDRGEKLMVEAQGGRKRKRGGEAKASGSRNVKNVVMSAEKRKTRSASREEAASAARAVRERKPMDRFVAGASLARNVGESMPFSIEQGPGTKLQDIPNVVFKLSKTKADENIQVLHTILYGRKSNAYSWKKNILQFSGFVWTKDKEKERAKVKEQLDKCNKKRLLVFCELLDIPDMKATAKKGEISAKLLEFLESPRVTRRDVVLAENIERGGKCKRIKESSQKASRETLPNIKNKKQKRNPSKEVKNFHPEEGSGIGAKQKVLPTKKGPPTKSDKSPSKPVSEKNRLSRKETSKKKAVNLSTKGKGKVKVSQRPPLEPTKEEMRPVLRDLASEMDLSNVNLDDVIKQLGARFKMDLKHRKKEVEQILQEGLSCAKNGEGYDQDGDADEAGKEDAEGSGKGKQGDDAGGEDAGGSGEDAGE